MAKQTEVKDPKRIQAWTVDREKLHGLDEAITAVKANAAVTRSPIALVISVISAIAYGELKKYSPLRAAPEVASIAICSATRWMACVRSMSCVCTRLAIRKSPPASTR